MKTSFQHVVLNAKSSTSRNQVTLQILFPFGVDREGAEVPVSAPHEWGLTIASLQVMCERTRDPTERPRLQLLLSMAITASQTFEEYSQWLQVFFGGAPAASVGTEDRIRCEDEYRQWRQRNNKAAVALPAPKSARHIENALTEVMTTVGANLTDEDGNEPCAEEVQRWVERVRSSPITVARGTKYQVSVDILSPCSLDETVGDLFTSMSAPGSVHPQFVVSLHERTKVVPPPKVEHEIVGAVAAYVQGFGLFTPMVNTGVEPSVEPCDILIHNDQPINSSETCRTFNGSVVRGGTTVPLAVKRLTLLGWGTAMRKSYLAEITRYQSVVRHPNAVVVYGSAYDPSTKESSVAMERVPGKSATSLRLPLPERAAKALVRVVFSVLERMEGLGMYVCAVPLSRILGIGEIVKVCPIPTSEYAAELLPNVADSGAALLPPEMRREGCPVVSPVVSTWALGVLCMQLMTGNTAASVQLLPPIHATMWCASFLSQCLEKDPNVRPDLASLRDHPFLTE